MLCNLLALLGDFLLERSAVSREQRLRLGTRLLRDARFDPLLAHLQGRLALGKAFESGLAFGQFLAEHLQLRRQRLLAH